MNIPAEIYDPSKIHTHCIDCGAALFDTPGGLVCTNPDCQDYHSPESIRDVWCDDNDQPWQVPF
jgi:uncharacterized Zn finger protein (UPF0148 family)